MASGGHAGDDVARDKNSVGRARELTYRHYAMALAVALKRQKFSLESLRAGDRLLRAIKDDLRKKGEKIDYNKLRKQGYSNPMIERLKEPLAFIHFCASS